MARTTPARTDAEWQVVIDRYLASGLSRSVFKATPPKRGRRRPLSKGLERVRVVHEIDPGHAHGTCGATLVEIGEEVSQQLALVPAEHFVIQTVRKKYARSGKACGVKTAAVPAVPLPGSQASPELPAYTMVVKCLGGIPLARQERMAAREGHHLPRAKLARRTIGASRTLQPLCNLFADTPGGASASASIYSPIETARANGYEPRRYLTVVLAELPDARSVEAIEALLPWRLTSEELARRYAARLKPTGMGTAKNAPA